MHMELWGSYLRAEEEVMIKHLWMTWESGHTQLPFTFWFVPNPRCMSHFMMDCYWVYPNLGSGGSDTTWFLTGSYGLVVTWCYMVREVFLPSLFKPFCFSCCSLPAQSSVFLCFMTLVTIFLNILITWTKSASLWLIHLLNMLEEAMTCYLLLSSRNDL